jgi:hypothetical protein
MKKSILLILVSISLAICVSCRKVVPAEERNGVTVYSALCSNGIMDEGEDDVDCGSTCVPCALSHADCDFELVDNEIRISNSGTDIYSFPASSITTAIVSGKLVITGTNGNKIIRATFAEEEPTVFAGHPVSEFNLEAGEVKLEFVNGSTTNTAYSGSVHLNRENGKLTIEFCDIFMDISSQGGYVISNGRFLSSN